MFLFSFYTRGMSFIDMAHLKRKIFRTVFIVSQTKDRATAGYQVGKMYAGDCRQIPGRQPSVLIFAGIEISF